MNYSPYQNYYNSNYVPPNLQALQNMQVPYANYQLQQQQQQPMMQQPMMQQPMMPQQPMFLQPSGSLYSIDNVDQIGNVPVSEGSISCVIFPNGNMMYLKTMQNGKPILLTYSLTNAEATKASNANEIIEKKPEPVKEDEFKVAATQQFNLLADNSKQLWNEVEGLKKKLTEIYNQLGVTENA